MNTMHHFCSRSPTKKKIILITSNYSIRKNVSFLFKHILSKSIMLDWYSNETHFKIKRVCRQNPLPMLYIKIKRDRSARSAWSVHPSLRVEGNSLLLLLL